MKHQLSPMSDHLICTATGEYNAKSLMQLISVMKTECENRSLRKLLFDVTGVINLFPDDMDRYYTGEALATQFKHKIKMAVVSRAEDITHFGENVATNRGAWMKIFSDYDQAMAWLL